MSNIEVKGANSLESQIADIYINENSSKVGATITQSKVSPSFFLSKITERGCRIVGLRNRRSSILVKSKSVNVKVV